MSIFENSIALTRYKVISTSPLLEELVCLESMQAALAKFGFKSIIDGNDEVSVGWVQINDLENPCFDNIGMLSIGDYLVFSLRRDARTLPALVLEGELKKEYDAWLEQHPNYRSVPKKAREEIKDAVKAKLLSRQLPDSNVWDVAWDIQGGILYMFNTSGKAMEVFEVMFKRTFGDHFGLRFLTPWEQAEELAAVHNIKHVLAETNRAGSNAVLDLVKSNSWLGRDFLLWLLSGQGQAACPGISAWVDAKIDLAGLSAEGGVEKISVTGSQNEMPAVKAALKAGSCVTKAGVFIEDNDAAKYSMVLAGDTFAIAQMKTPAVTMEQTEDPIAEYQGAFLEKMAVINKGLGYLQSLFGEFLKVRVAGFWTLSSVRINEWMEE